MANYTVTFRLKDDSISTCPNLRPYLLSNTKINLNMWRTTYKNLISLKTIDSRFLTYDDRVNKTIDLIENNNTYIVAEINSTIVGFILYVPSDDVKFECCGEIKALYVLDEYHHNGIGQALFNLAVIELGKLGFHHLVIDCIVGNPANECRTVNVEANVESQNAIAPSIIPSAWCLRFIAILWPGQNGCD